MTIPRWNQGRTEIDDLLGRGWLQRIHPNREQADQQIAQARRHLESAEYLLSETGDLEASAALLYDAARKALASVLANEGLRATSDGGHLAIFQAVLAQLVPPLGKVIQPFDRLRRQRNRSEYPHTDQHSTPPLRTDDLMDDIAKSREIVEACATVLESMPVY